MDQAHGRLRSGRTQRKMDLLTAQVQYPHRAGAGSPSASAAGARRTDARPDAHRQRRVSAWSTEQLEEVQEYVDLGDLLRLLKRLLRNGRNFDKMLDQLESVMDLAQTIGPLSDSMLRQGHRRARKRRNTRAISPSPEAAVQSSRQHRHFLRARRRRPLGDNIVLDPRRRQGHDAARDHGLRAQHRLASSGVDSRSIPR